MTRRLRILFLLVLLAAAPRPLLAQDTKAQEEKIARLQQEIALLNNQLKDNASQSSNALSELTLIRKQIKSRQELIAESDKKISAIRRSISEKQHEIDVIQARLDTLNYYYAKLIHNAYKNRDTRVWYMYILASDNVAQAFRRFGYLKNLSAEMNVQARKIAAVKAELQEQTAQLQVMQKEAEALRAERQKDVDQLKSEEARSQQIIAKLNTDLASLRPVGKRLAEPEDGQFFTQKFRAVRKLFRSTRVGSGDREVFCIESRSLNRFYPQNQSPNQQKRNHETTSTHEYLSNVLFTKNNSHFYFTLYLKKNQPRNGNFWDFFAKIRKISEKIAGDSGPQNLYCFFGRFCYNQ